MADFKKRVYRLDDDTVEVAFIFDLETQLYLGDFPDFSENPKYTPGGRPWVNVTNDSCTFAEHEYGDCGSCKFFRCEQSGDLIGICENEHLRKDDSE